jgi:hypothetical protein
LWQEDEERKPLWPRAELVALSAHPMKNLDDIVKGISRFVKY